MARTKAKTIYYSPKHKMYDSLRSYRVRTDRYTFSNRFRSNDIMVFDVSLINLAAIIEKISSKYKESGLIETLIRNILNGTRKTK